MRRTALILTITAAGLAAAAAVAGTASSAPSKHNAVSGNISMSGVWAGAEAKNFNLVLAAFMKANPGVHVKYTSTGDNTPTVLSTAVQGGQSTGTSPRSRSRASSRTSPTAEHSSRSRS